MVEKRKIALLVLVAVFVLGMSLGNSNYQFQVERIEAGSWVEIPVQFTPAADTPQWIDATQTTTYGTITNGPPNGMGNSDSGPTDDTELLEESYLYETYETKVDEDFSGGEPAGWYADDFSFDNVIAYADAVVARELHHGGLDLTGYGLVNISYQAGSYDTNYLEDVDWALYRYNGTNLVVQYITGCGSDTNFRDFEYSMNSNEYDNFHYFFGDVTALAAERVKIDNVLVEAEISATYYRFDAVFRFDSVTYSASNYYLYVDFYTALTGSDDLDMYIETGDTTPDAFKCAEDKQDDFYIDVTQYITGDTVYLQIYDDYRTGDDSQTTAYIQQIYLFTAPDPEWAVIDDPAEMWLDVIGWANLTDIEFFFPVGWSAEFQFGYDAFFILLGLIMIPASTMYLVRGGREEMNADKFFFGVVIFAIGIGLLIGGIIP